MGIFDTLIIHPIINALVAVYQGLDALNVPYPLGFAIILLTIIIRFIMYPLFTTQLKASKKMQDIAPHLSNLKDKHKGDSKRIQQETMKLYKEHGVNPLAGCLPILLQLPITIGLYQVFDKIFKLKGAEFVAYINDVVYSQSLKIGSAWDTSFFGIPLEQSPSKLMESFVIVAIMVPLLTGIFQFIQSKMLFPSIPSDKKKKSDDFATMFQTQSTYIFPIMIAAFSFTFPVGLSLYWNTFTIFGIIHQYKISGPGGLAPLWQKIKKQLKK